MKMNCTGLQWVADEKEKFKGAAQRTSEKLGVLMQLTEAHLFYSQPKCPLMTARWKSSAAIGALCMCLASPDCEGHPFSQKNAAGVK